VEKFDVIVVGAGLSGLAAASVCIGGGLNTLVLERGIFPGAKNVSGGRLYLKPVASLLPEFSKGDLPIERPVTHERLTLMDGSDSLTLSLQTPEFRSSMPQSVTVLRAVLDRWFAERLGECGGIVVPKIRVDGVIREKGRICGIRAAGDEIGANVVIAADGVNALLSERAGLRSSHDPAHFAVAAKEIIELSSGAIEERFQLNNGEGAAQLFAGSVTRGMPGGGFLYTNRETLSLGVVVGVQAAGSSKVPVHELVEEFKDHPAVAPLVRGGNVVEYSAHLIPEAGPYHGTSLSTDGFLTVGDAAGFCLNLGVTVRGMDYALASGVLAGQAVLKAHETGDFSREILSTYDRSVRESFIGKDFKTYRKVPRFLGNPRLYSLYPQALTGAFKDLYRVTENPKGKIVRGFRNSLFSRISLGQALRDVIRGYQAL